MPAESYSLSDMERERDELRKDLISFTSAYDTIRKRIVESTEVPRSPELYEWSGTSAVCGALEMSIHAIERTIVEYDSLIQKILAGELINRDLHKINN